MALQPVMDSMPAIPSLTFRTFRPETDDPVLQGEMTIMFNLTDADGGGTDLVAVHNDLPSGVPPADNEMGWQSSLAKLAALVEAG